MMTDPKDRFYKARRRAVQILGRSGFRVTILRDGIFDIEASDEDTIKKIKICLDAVPARAIEQIGRAILPPYCRRQIWLKKDTAPDFEILKVKPCQ